MSAATRDPTLAGNVMCRAANLGRVGTAWRWEGDLQRARRLFDEALDLPYIASYPAVYLNCLAEREFTRLRAVSSGDERCLRAVQEAACRHHLEFIELKCAFLRACLGTECGDGDVAATELPGVVSRQLELGHVNFVGHELTLLPDLTAALLGHCGRMTAAGLIDALCRHWNPLPMAIKALTISEPVAVQALRTAAAGFSEEDLYRLVRRARRSSYPAVRRLAAELMTAGGGETGPPAVSLPELTPREAEVLGLIACGRSNAELAAELCLSPATVKTHINHIFSKLGVRDRVQAIIAYRSRMMI
jgi:DNA-binding CsgD family transcriptional regulator